jgi:positive regulator of sigma E activity
VFPLDIDLFEQSTVSPVLPPKYKTGYPEHRAVQSSLLLPVFPEDTMLLFLILFEVLTFMSGLNINTAHLLQSEAKNKI